MERPVIEEKSFFNIQRLVFPSQLDWCSQIISTAKTTSKKLGALICSMTFLSPEVTVSL